jgi:hypothetical protein
MYRNRVESGAGSSPPYVADVKTSVVFTTSATYWAVIQQEGTGV